jgi:hypothetical protein
LHPLRMIGNPAVVSVFPQCLGRKNSHESDLALASRVRAPSFWDEHDAVPAHAKQ